MAEEKDQPIPLSDDDLLENAIPIDSLEDEEESGGAGAATSDRSEIDSIDLAEAPEGEQLPEGAEGIIASNKIQAFGQRARHQSKWARQPNTTGTGAIHVKTFVAKLRLDAIEHLDQQINEWLDSNPEYEVKLVTTSVGELKGKITETALFVNVWV